MRLIDTNVFVHAFLKPRKNIQPHETNIKQQAKKIIQKIDNGEHVVISTVNLSEIVNIIDEIYSFDADFDKIKTITRLRE